MFYVGIIFICVVGTLLHFVYELSNHNKWVAIFAAVNESTWEHIKIGMTATFLWSLYDGFVFGMNPNYIIAKSMCLFTIIILIPVLFYTYTAFTKRSILWVDVICFIITIIISQLVFRHYIMKPEISFAHTYICAILLFLEIASYMLLTYIPMKNFIFRDPISKKYGLKGHTELDHHHKE